MADIPLGTIVMYSGTDIPDGWLLCDGENGTPNLIDKFILAGNITESGLSNNIQFSGSGGDKKIQVKSADSAVEVSVKQHALTIDEIPEHNHKQGDIYEEEKEYDFQFGDWRVSGSGGFIGGGDSSTASSRYGPYTDKSGAGEAHTHEATSQNHNHDVNITQPYYILAFILYSE